MSHKIRSIPIKIVSLIAGLVIACALASITTNAAGTAEVGTHDLRRTTKYSFATLGWTMHRVYGGGAYSTSEYVAIQFNKPYVYEGRNFIVGYRRMNDANILAEAKNFSESWFQELGSPGEHLVCYNALMTWCQTVNGQTRRMGYLIADGSKHGGIQGIGWPRGLDEAHGKYVSSFEDAYKNVPTKGIIYRWGWLHNTVQSSYTKDTSDNWWRARGSTNDVEDHYNIYHKIVRDKIIPEEQAPAEEVRPLKVFDPDIKTYHYDTTYNVGEGIPSGKPITNGIYASHWRGDYVTQDVEIERKWKVNTKMGVTRSYYVPDGYWDATYDDYGYPNGSWYVDTSYTDYDNYEIERPVEITKKAKYRIIRRVEIDQLKKVRVENDSYGVAEYDAGELGYADLEPNIICNINDEKVTEWQELYPSDKEALGEHHVIWPEIPDELVVSHYTYPNDGGRFSDTDIWNANDSDTKARDQIGNVIAWNDDLQITDNGKVLLYVKGKELEGIAEDHDVADALALTPAEIDNMVVTNPTYVEREKGLFIPQSTPNFKYYTDATFTYARVCPFDEVEYKFDIGFSSEDKFQEVDYIKNGSDPLGSTYYHNEPVVVHTPVVAPVSMSRVDGRTVSKFNPNGDKTQLINLPPTETQYGEPIYNLLLDNTYSMTFDAYQWLSEQTNDEGMSHGQTTNSEVTTKTNPSGKTGHELTAYEKSKYREYIDKVEVVFPIDVGITDGAGNVTKYVRAGDTVTFGKDDETIGFYIVPWAEEATTAYPAGNEQQRILITVYAYNYLDGNLEDINNLKLLSDGATFQVPINVSGWIYGFEIDGTSDRDMFEGYTQDITKDQEVAFAPLKEEKKSGPNNRFGGTWKRYTLQHLLVQAWKPQDTLPLRDGTSHAYSGMGAIWPGTKFSFSVKTIANLSDQNDEVIIIPRYKYIEQEDLKNGATVHAKSNIRVYYSDEDNLYVEYGSNKDKALIKSVKLNDPEFVGSWLEKDKFLETWHKKELPSGYQSKLNDDLDFTVRHDGVANKETFINRATDSYSLGSIVLKPTQRILSGTSDELRINEKAIKTDGSYSTATENATSEDEFRSSMQTWYGQYKIPENIYVTDADVDIDGDGVKSTLDSRRGEPGYHEGDDVDKNGVIDLRDVSQQRNGDMEGFFKKNGYLILNFDIRTRNGGVDHLHYWSGIGALGGGGKDSPKSPEDTRRPQDPNSDPNTNMWKTESILEKISLDAQIPDNGQPGSPQDPNTPDNPSNGDGSPDYGTCTYELTYGDVVVIDMRYQTSQKISSHIMIP